ncbi:MAG: EscU/YscU/HrcU family type III secretion system export apparatus switch protein, partial [Planctomycetaceae bacterium]|nr:EscU/YscU/HrcU family type III secretion system export apparatus switch protein [Planctomycetaceae bacterium]
MRAGDQHDRTIAPTARRLSEARRAGATAHSRELVSAASAGAAVVAIILLSSQLWTATRDLLRAVWSAPLTRLSNGPVPEAAAAALLQIAGLVAVLLVVPLVAAVLANALQTGFRLNVRWPQLRFATVSPMAGLR